MTELPTLQQLEDIARSSDPRYQQMDPTAQEAQRERIRHLLSALDSQGWEIARRADRTTFEMALFALASWIR